MRARELSRLFKVDDCPVCQGGGRTVSAKPGVTVGRLGQLRREAGVKAVEMERKYGVSSVWLSRSELHRPEMEPSPTYARAYFLALGGA